MSSTLTVRSGAPQHAVTAVVDMSTRLGSF